MGKGSAFEDDRIGETNLRTLLAEMRPSLSSIQFGFATVASPQEIPAQVEIVGIFHEDEGVTVISPWSQIAPARLTCSGPWAKITLAVHSSLAAVGLTAKVAGALAAEGISANVVAAFFHDHIFVPWDERENALRTLNALSGGSTQPGKLNL